MNLNERAIYTAEAEGIEVIDYPLTVAKSAILSDSGYALILDKSQIESQEEEACLLWHELGHYFTGSLHQLSAPYELRSRCEYRASAWAAKALCPLEKLKKALASGCRSTWELSEYIGLPEELLKNALEYYRRKGDLPAAGTIDKPQAVPKQVKKTYRLNKKMTAFLNRQENQQR
ncbi:MAG: ImmA/IrrE family metallo-endopeptidase [Clostridiales bacterium]